MKKLSKDEMKKIRGGSGRCPTEGEPCSFTVGTTVYHGACVWNGSPTYCYCDAPGQPITLKCANQ